jgi:hypothetical protein
LETTTCLLQEHNAYLTTNSSSLLKTAFFQKTNRRKELPSTQETAIPLVDTLEVAEILHFLLLPVPQG